MVRTVLALLLLGAASASAQQVTPEAQGHVDRVGFEDWIKSLPTTQRTGADFWAAERNKPAPVSCLGTDQAADPEFVAGCQDAQRRLALPDVRRKTEPSYRIGWNAPVSVAAAPSPRAVPEAGAHANCGFVAWSAVSDIRTRYNRGDQIYEVESMIDSLGVRASLASYFKEMAHIQYALPNMTLREFLQIATERCQANPAMTRIESSSR